MSAVGNGLAQGIAIGNSLVDAYERGQNIKKRGEIENVMANGLAQAKASRQQAVDSNVVVGSEANAADTMTVPTFQDGQGKRFGSEAETRANAERKAPSVDDFYLRDVAPKIRETYLAQGNAAGADQWDKWTQDKQAQTGMKHWTQALRAGQMGDFKSYADNMVKAYNTPGYYEDGLEANGYDLIKDKDGNTTGLTMNLKNKETGEEFSQSIHGQDDMIRQGIGLLDPANAFKTTFAQNEKQKTRDAQSVRDQQKFQQQVALSDRKDVSRAELADRREDSAMERLVRGKQLDRENQNKGIEQKTNALRAAGYSDEFIKESLPQMMGVGNYKRGSTPEETRRMLHQARLSDFNYQRKSPAEQAAIIDQDLKLIGGGSSADGSSARTTQEPASPGKKNPLSGGLLPGAEGKKPVMIYDNKTQQMVPYTR